MVILLLHFHIVSTLSACLEYISFEHGPVTDNLWVMFKVARKRTETTKYLRSMYNIHDLEICQDSSFLRAKWLSISPPLYMQFYMPMPRVHGTIWSSLNSDLVNNIICISACVWNTFEVLAVVTTVLHAFIQIYSRWGVYI